MQPATYELRKTSEGGIVFKCLFCGNSSSDAGSVERLHCGRCDWFHEPLDDAGADLSRHLYAAVQEVRSALDLAETAGEDREKIEFLHAALRELRKALSRV